MGVKNIPVPVTPDLEAYIDAKVASGDYADAGEVARDGLYALMQQEAERLQWLRDAIAKGEADIAAGRTRSPEQLNEELAERKKAWLAARRKATQ